MLALLGISQRLVAAVGFPTDAVIRVRWLGNRQHSHGAAFDRA